MQKKLCVFYDLLLENSFSFEIAKLIIKNNSHEYTIKIIRVFVAIKRSYFEGSQYLLTINNKRD